VATRLLHRTGVSELLDSHASALDHNAHFPSGQFPANSAWTVIAALSHNLGRWTSLVGLPDDSTRTAATRRRRLFRIPGRLTRTSRQWTLRLPARWPWQQDFNNALTRIRALPALT
jgi:hypothetical protein